jgi:4-hydroxybenzoate polyprenyltransferase
MLRAFSKKLISIARLLRLDRPTGTLLLFFPCAFAIILLSQNLYDLFYYLALFLLGSILMRSSGCIINDILDRDLDAKVARTNNRPLVTQEVSIKAAVITLLLLLLMGLCILLQLSTLARQIGILALVLVVFYPLIKRFSHFPQVFLGFTFNIGTLVVAADMRNTIPLESIFLYIGCIFWTIGYDTVYGFMDIKDDKKIGVKSLARLLEKANFKIWLGAFYALFVVCLLISCLIATSSLSSYLLLIMLLVLLQNAAILDHSCPKSCMKHFNSSIFIGISICIILIFIKFRYL